MHFKRITSGITQHTLALAHNLHIIPLSRHTTNPRRLDGYTSYPRTRILSTLWISHSRIRSCSIPRPQWTSHPRPISQLVSNPLGISHWSFTTRSSKILDAPRSQDPLSRSSTSQPNGWLRP